MKKIKFGIIGFGFIGHIHENTLTNKIEAAEVAAICDISPSRMEDAVTPNVKKYTDFHELLAQEDVQVVIISVPNHLHCEIVKAAANAGKDIICEKPVAMNSEELEEMLSVVERCGVHFTVHQQRRFDQDFSSMKEVYDSGTLGNVYTIQSKIFGFNGNMHDWHIYRKYGGGMLYDWGIHLIDQMLYMVDSKVKTVFADVRNVIHKEVDDYFKVLLTFENGITGELELGTYFLSDKENWFEHHWFIGGDKGSAYCDGFVPEGKIVKTKGLREHVADKVKQGNSGPTRSFGTPNPGWILTEEIPHPQTEHKMYFENYVESYDSGTGFLVTIPQIRRSLRLLDAIKESAEKNRTIEFES